MVVKVNRVERVNRFAEECYRETCDLKLNKHLRTLHVEVFSAYFFRQVALSSIHHLSTE